MKDGQDYKELGAEHVNKGVEKKRKAYLKKELENLGYDVNLVVKEKIPESAWRNNLRSIFTGTRYLRIAKNPSMKLTSTAKRQRLWRQEHVYEILNP